MSSGGYVMNLSDLLRGAHQQEEPEASSPIPEAQIMELNGYFDRYTKKCPFKPGDIITPRKSSYLNGAGTPHVVLEVYENPVAWWSEESPAQSMNGCKLDVRIAAYLRDRIGTWTGESFQYELWSKEEVVEPVSLPVVKASTSVQPKSPWIDTVPEVAKAPIEADVGKDPAAMIRELMAQLGVPNANT